MGYCKPILGPLSCAIYHDQLLNALSGVMQTVYSRLRAIGNAAKISEQGLNLAFQMQDLTICTVHGRLQISFMQYSVLAGLALQRVLRGSDGELCHARTT